ncbi:hypothetical protein IWQ60_003740 [Tieghemiomyces parasiticus]|uniref:SART-1 protein n=1 Tax=Tieghemiomyces parasiticus TaxID=78921 RepID=A0A9W8DZS1_9FUNG|nr:hypothetical protein IWQ60_003740 [Tieghemiomyces parasiticus]
MSSHATGAASDEDIDDPLAWIQRSRRLEQQRKQAAKQKKKQAKAAAAQGASNVKVQDYDADALSGMKVGHALTEFESGQEQILTLKDTGVLDGEEDELTSVGLQDREKLQDNLANRKRKSGYSGYDDDEFQGTIGRKRTVLAHYDEEIEGRQRQGFTLAQGGTVSTMAADQSDNADPERGPSTDLSYEKHRAVQDYYTPEETDLTFRKVKKKTKKAKRIRVREEDPERAADPAPSARFRMDIDDHSPADPSEESNVVDDDDLQIALARTRRLKMREKRTAVVPTAEQLAEEYGRQRMEAALDEVEDESKLVVSETRQFVDGLSLPPPPTSPTATTSAAGEPESTMAVDLPEEAGALDALLAPQGMSPAPLSPEAVPDEPAADTGPSLTQQEPLVSEGLAATLALLNQKGILKKATPEEKKREQILQDRQRWIAEQRRLDLQRELQEKREKEKRRALGNKDRKGAAGMEAEQRREAELAARDRERTREVEERMRHYKPDVRLEYTDEFGRSLGPKEAFRQLSHKFHGIYSGKGKTDKRLKKIELERKLMAAGSHDTPLHLASIFQKQQEVRQSPYVVLSTGNKQTVHHLGREPNPDGPNDDTK